MGCMRKDAGGGGEARDNKAREGGEKRGEDKACTVTT